MCSYICFDQPIFRMRWICFICSLFCNVKYIVVKEDLVIAIFACKKHFVVPPPQLYQDETFG